MEKTLTFLIVYKIYCKVDCMSELHINELILKATVTIYFIYSSADLLQIQICYFFPTLGSVCKVVLYVNLQNRLPPVQNQNIHMCISKNK